MKIIIRDLAIFFEDLLSFVNRIVLGGILLYLLAKYWLSFILEAY